MKLLTKEIERKLIAAAAVKDETYANLRDKRPVILKLFNPAGGETWYITDGEKTEDGDWLMFGLCCIHETELGYVSLNELIEFKGQFGLGIERDLHWTGTVEDAMKTCA